MQVAGAQPAGSRGLSGVSVVVNDSQSNKSGFSASSTTQEQGGNRVALALTAEPVVFPREGLPVDQRPTQLRLLKAATRYKESKELEPQPGAPTRQGRRAS